MKKVILAALAGIAFAAPSVQAEEVKNTGTICWTGDITFIGTGEKDMAWVWDIDWTFLSDDKDPAKGQTGKCYGSGAMNAGVPEAMPFFCKHTLADGSTHMARAVGSDDEAEGVIFGGTGVMAGASGGWTGGATMPLPADDGKLAGCRPAVFSFDTSG